MTTSPHTLSAELRESAALIRAEVHKLTEPTRAPFLAQAARYDSIADLIDQLSAERAERHRNEVRMTAVFAAEHARAEALQSRADRMEGILREIAPYARADGFVWLSLDGKPLRDAIQPARAYFARDCLEALAVPLVGLDCSLRAAALHPCGANSEVVADRERGEC